jgi:putative spermidine/putrescine transport system substrate-binding protein
MKNRLKLALAAGALAGAGLLTVAMAARPLTVVSWGGAFQEAQKKAFFEPFKATGSALIDESWDGGVGVLRSKTEGGADAGWDVVEVESEELLVGCEEGLFVQLDWSRIGGKDAYLPEAVHECGVGNILYNFVLAYDKDKLKTAPAGWADFFDTAKFPGKRALRGGPKTNLEIALMGDGVAHADVYKTLATEEGVARAFKKLETIKKDMIWWKSGAQPPQLLASGEVVMTSAYNGRIDAANRNDKRNFGIQWNGSLFTVDSWVILKTTPNLDEAYKFVALAGQAEHQAKIPEHIAYGVTNKDAAAKIDPKRLAELPTHPDNFSKATKISDQFWLENIDRLTERFNTWAAN